MVKRLVAHVFLCLSVCLTRIGLSVCLSVCLSVIELFPIRSVFARLRVCVSVCLSVCLCVCVSVCLPVDFPPFGLCGCVSHVCLCVCVSYVFLCVASFVPALWFAFLMV